MSSYLRVPPPDVAAIDPKTGKWIDDYYDIIKRLDQLQPLSDIPPESPFTVTPITPSTTSVAVTTGVLTDATGGTVASTVSATGLVAAIKNDTASMAFYINALRTDLLASQTAVAALNTRITALENKIDAVISDLDARFP